MCYASDNCATIANLHMPNMLDGLYEQRMFMLHEYRTLDLTLAGQCSNCQITFLGLYIQQLREVIDIHNVCWASQPHIEQWHKTLPARQRQIERSVLVQ